VGPVTAAAFVATIDDAQRFHRAHEVAAYFGLVPRELSSGESPRWAGSPKRGIDGMAVVPLARRFAGLLYAMLRDGKTYEPRAVPRHAAEAAAPV
jgi:transposase